ncbi:MAG: helix-turn-helix transcriptional regulator [Angelakisella sp.]|nr:helix-turn-helix transcriptional regulator [Angelakisella sp.]
MENVLSQRIRTILQEQNLKQTELAAALGVSNNYISLLANGKKTGVSLTLAKLIESLYGYPAEWVMTGQDDHTRREELLRRAAIEKIQKMNEIELMKLKEFIPLP